ncbi:TetR family transcriptional regulator [Sphingomonas sp. MMS24-JH45]
MEAAVTTIQRLGYGGATTAIIASEAGVTRGALTHRWNSART